MEDWTEFEAGVAKVCNLPIYVDDSTRTLADIVAKTSVMNAKGKCGIVFIDYLGLIRFDGRLPIYIQISEVTKSLKRLAKDCRCPVVLLCQLNRNNVKEKRPPELQDSRGVALLSDTDSKMCRCLTTVSQLHSLQASGRSRIA